MKQLHLQTGYARVRNIKCQKEPFKKIKKELLHFDSCFTLTKDSIHLVSYHRLQNDNPLSSSAVPSATLHFHSSDKSQSSHSTS